MAAISVEGPPAEGSRPPGGGLDGRIRRGGDAGTGGRAPGGDVAAAAPPACRRGGPFRRTARPA